MPPEPAGGPSPSTTTSCLAGVHPNLLQPTMATFIPVKFTEFCQPDATMPFGKELMQITKDLRIALPTITGKPTSCYPEDSCYRIEVHVPGRTFEPRTEPVDFKFIAPN
ncbi:hypothetical protein D1007_31994 [Hordeum vulgare]|nr:hypothetical protein D1007_31994 [Hordeum vulgare]